MSVKAKTLLSLVLVAACLVLARSNAYAQSDPTGVDSTHYWTYQLIDPVYFPQPIVVQDQFLPAPITNVTDSLTRLVNWVYKNNSTVRDTMIHYTWWNLQNKYPVNQFVTVTNQFGSYDVSVYQLDFLLAPAWKNNPSPIQGGPEANHYLCYKANGFPPPPLPYSLQDEWRNDYLPVGQLEYLCVPCSKQHNGQNYAIVDSVTHLALYRIHPLSDIFYPQIQDQFVQVQRAVQQRPIEYLMVPSLKTLIPTDIKTSTWGKLKKLYR